MLRESWGSINGSKWKKKEKYVCVGWNRFVFLSVVMIWPHPLTWLDHTHTNQPDSWLYLFMVLCNFLRLFVRSQYNTKSTLYDAQTLQLSQDRNIRNWSARKKNIIAAVTAAPKNDEFFLFFTRTSRPRGKNINDWKQNNFRNHLLFIHLEFNNIDFSSNRNFCASQSKTLFLSK